SINLLQVPLASDDRVDQPGKIQHGIGDQLAPRQCVAYTSIQWIWTVFGKSDDVRSRLDARKLSEQTSNACSDQNCEKPEAHCSIDAMCKKIERHRTRCQVENRDPDRPVRQTVMRFIAFT